MPLRDHFIPPLSVSHPWSGFHSAWAAAVAQQLNRGVLPPRYYAIPNVQLGGPIEIDVATLGDDTMPDAAAQVSAFAWTAPEPALTAVVDFAPVDVVEV